MDNSTGVFFTGNQFKLWLNDKKCSMCDKRATYLPKFDGDNIAYCDEHYPFGCDCEICKGFEK